MLFLLIDERQISILHNSVNGDLAGYHLFWLHTTIPQCFDDTTIILALVPKH